MIVKHFLPLMLCLLFVTSASSQKAQPRFSIGAESQFLVGGELNSSFNFLIGLRATYFLRRKKQFTPFVSFGLATDIGTTDSRLIATDLMVGSYWNFSKRFSVLGGIGGQNVQESHSFQLIEGTRNWQNSTFGATVHLGLKYDITKHISTRLFVKQFNFSSTSIGLGLQYSF